MTETNGILLDADIVSHFIAAGAGEGKGVRLIRRPGARLVVAGLDG